MVNKKIFIFGMIFLASFLFANFISAQDVSYCCERTVAGAWCQDTEESKCDSAYRKTPSSCESTSYCI